MELTTAKAKVTHVFKSAGKLATLGAQTLGFTALGAATFIVCDGLRKAEALLVAARMRGEDVVKSLDKEHANKVGNLRKTGRNKIRGTDHVN
jgi:hypothetical protein